MVRIGPSVTDRRGVASMYAHTPVRTPQSTKNVSVASRNSTVQYSTVEYTHSYMYVPPGKKLATPLDGISHIDWQLGWVYSGDSESFLAGLSKST